MNVDALFAKLKAAFTTLSVGQLASLTLAFIAVVGLTIGSAYYLNTPTYGVLFSDLDAEAATAVTSKLKSEKIAYSIDDGGKTIRVPLNRVDDLRLELAGQGMPGSGRIGFELFDRTAFGVTDFLEHVNYRRALEGELARTISTIGEVASARVHIAMPQPSLFAGREQQQTKASVVLKLRNNRQLQPATVTAITGLVSAAVESLRPESVVIIDNFGRPLSQQGQEKDDQGDGLPIERQQRIERDLSTRVVAMLEPIVGAGRARVNVSAKLKSATEEQTEERWDPETVMRSEQSVTQTASTNQPGAQGIAGAKSNLPPDPAKPETAPAAVPVAPPTPTNGTSYLASTKNYEIGKLVRHSVQPRGDIDKLSVAVVLDDERSTDAEGKTKSTPRPAGDIEKVKGLVAAAVGLDTERGDTLTVENIAFEETPTEDIPEPGMWQVYGTQTMEVGRMIGVVLIGLFAVFAVIRPLMRASLSPGGVPAMVPAGGGGGPRNAPRTVQDLENEIDSQLEGLTGAARMPVLTKRVSALTEREPENAARLIRTWLTEDER